MRAKFVYEAFKEDSDPIEDIGIGIENEINQIMKANEVPNHIILEPISKIKYLIYKFIDINYIIYLIEKYDVIKNDHNQCLLRDAAFNQNYEVAKYLIENGANLDIAITMAYYYNSKLTLCVLKHMKDLIENNLPFTK